MHTTSFGCLIALCVISIANEITAAETLAGKRPNIVFVLTDDQGYGDLSCHGNPILKTPNIDRLHREGVRFTDFMVSPTCSPTRSALMTGRHEFRNGITHTINERERLTLSATTLAQVLKSAGYATGIFGKWHLGDEPDHWPSRRGFDEMFIHGAGGIGQSYPGSCGDAPGNTYFSPAILHNGKFEKTNGYCTDVFFAQALKWIEATKGKQPFYAHISTNAPHGPLQVRPEDEARYADKVDDPNAAKFFGMIANIDDNVGKLLAKLSEWGIERDTLVIFMNDNGGTAGVKVYNAGMRAQKGTPWIGGTRASSLWRWPGTLKPADCDRLAAHIDFFPTLAELAGAKLTGEVQKQVEGRSLVSLLSNPQADWSDRTLFTHVGRWPVGADRSKFKYATCSVRNSRFQMVTASKGETKNWQLFDLKADPGEKTDITDQHPDVVKQLDSEYDRWWESVQPQLVNEDAVPPAENPFKTLFNQQFAVGDSKLNATNGTTRTDTTEKKTKDPPKKAAAKKANPSLEKINDVPGLPRVLLIGDSISMGYTLPVRKLLDGKANVHRIPVNGGPTTNGIANLKKWLGDGKWDVIHFNWGLHDLKLIDDKHQVPIDEYEKNLRELVTQMKATNAKLIWCSTTPVPDGASIRNKDDGPKYNAVAKKIMDEMKVPIDDLYEFALPQLDKIQLKQTVHFSPAGSEVLAQQVVKSIEQHLPKK
ncbi:MAG: sulfatase-like hydrolase/transferase [Planctomycetaceae bacterium]|nr:sulfatase-like hydrolase/transferase [Planctomycetaceae bacterium]